MVTDGFREFVLEQLRRASPATITHRPLFGGVGIYADGLFFGFMANDMLYFKVDDTNRGYFEDRGMGPFLPYGDPDRPMSHWQVPGDLLEEPDQLGTWMERSLDVARRAKKQ
ncbi:MAG TPA: TfoX/Sxy family protein [Longimicrobiales bacterium]|nr:TfoX/Sxy family protein [Longimicrobiales bacterium]